MNAHRSPQTNLEPRVYQPTRLAGRRLEGRQHFAKDGEKSEVWILSNATAFHTPLPEYLKARKEPSSFPLFQTQSHTHRIANRQTTLRNLLGIFQHHLPHLGRILVRKLILLIGRQAF